MSTVDGSITITDPPNKRTYYYYSKDGISYWGYEPTQMFSPMQSQIEKTGPKSFNLIFFSEPEKISYLRQTINISDGVNGTGSVKLVNNFPDHPDYGIEKEHATLSYEILTSEPSLPPTLVSGQYDLDGSQMSLSNGWIDIVDKKFVSYTSYTPDPQYHFKYKFPLDLNWTMEWIDLPNQNNSLQIDFSNSFVNFGMNLGSRSASFNFDWNPVDWNILMAIQSYEVQGVSYNPSQESGIRIKYIENERKFIGEFDENLSGNWKEVVWANLDIGVNSFKYLSPTSGLQENMVDSNYTFSDGTTKDVSTQINSELLKTSSIGIYFSSLDLNRLVSFKVDIGATSNFASSGSIVGLNLRSIDWFGVYYFANDPSWIYHLELGWIYTESTGVDSIWFWDQTMGWCWTSKSQFPFIFKALDNEWTYFKRKSSPRKFYDFSNNIWK